MSPQSQVEPERRAVSSEAAERYVPLEKSKRQGIGLCLSGGGYRATLFHMGALRRLNECGVLTREDFRSVCSVSGGSIAAAALAAALARIKPQASSGAIAADVWSREFREPLRNFTKSNIRTGAVARRLLPWNWFRSSTGVEALARTYEKRLTPLPLTSLPHWPNFVFCATDMAYGVSWVFERDRMGDYQAGYKSPPSPSYPSGLAVAASSCFPPVFNPLPIKVGPDELTGGRASPGKDRDVTINGLRLTDGGVYDNMGLEPVWKDHECVLVSDAGGLFAYEGDKGLFSRLQRYIGIQERQSGALRKRWLISNFLAHEMEGTYWGISSAVASYGYPDGYSEAFAKDVIAEIRTDLDAFSDAEAAVLENHGYLLADAALRKHVQTLVPAPVPPVQIPHPEWMDEGRAKDALKDSSKRKLLGRRN